MLNRRTIKREAITRGAGLLLSLCLLPPLHAAEPDKTIRLASLEWLPYVGPRLEREGLSAYIVADVARQIGYRTRIDYFPWPRAMQLGAKDAQYVGYFPAYYTDERAQQCHFSSPIGNSTIGFAYLKSAPLHWQSLQDLAPLKIAVVAGYSNGPAFDALARQGRLDIDPSPSDVLNLRKLLARRVNIVVIDKQALRYLLATEPTLAKERDRIAFHERPLAELSLHVCFQKTPQGRALQQAFDAALQTIPLRKEESDYFRRLERETVPP